MCPFYLCKLHLNILISNPEKQNNYKYGQVEDHNPPAFLELAGLFELEDEDNVIAVSIVLQIRLGNRRLRTRIKIQVPWCHTRLKFNVAEEEVAVVVATLFMAHNQWQPWKGTGCPSNVVQGCTISKVLVLVLVPVLVLMVASVLFLVLVPVLFLVLALVLV